MLMNQKFVVQRINRKSKSINNREKFFFFRIWHLVKLTNVNRTIDDRFFGVWFSEKWPKDWFEMEMVEIVNIKWISKKEIEERCNPRKKKMRDRKSITNIDTNFRQIYIFGSDNSILLELEWLHVVVNYIKFGRKTFVDPVICRGWQEKSGGEEGEKRCKEWEEE